LLQAGRLTLQSTSYNNERTSGSNRAEHQVQRSDYE
jgi:hypothetical protein